jgi:thiamine biosynthesis lipoprotein ApbE
LAGKSTIHTDRWRWYRRWDLGLQSALPKRIGRAHRELRVSACIGGDKENSMRVDGRHFQVIFDPDQRCASIHRKDTVTVLDGPFNSFAEAEAAAYAYLETATATTESDHPDKIAPDVVN